MEDFGIVCAVIGGLGILLCIIGFAIGVSNKEVRSALEKDLKFEWDFQKDREIHDTHSDDTNHEIYEGIRNLEVEVGRMQVYVAVNENEDAVRVEKQMGEGTNLQVYQEDDTLIIETEDGGHGKHHDGVIRIYIPKDMMLQSAEFSIGAGLLKTDRISAEEINIECGAGEVELTAAGQETDYNYNVEVGVGEAVIGGSKFGGLAVEKTIDNQADKEMVVECGAGKVTVTFEQ